MSKSIQASHGQTLSESKGENLIRALITSSSRLPSCRPTVNPCTIEEREGAQNRIKHRTMMVDQGCFCLDHLLRGCRLEVQPRSPAVKHRSKRHGHLLLEIFCRPAAKPWCIPRKQLGKVGSGTKRSQMEDTRQNRSRQHIIKTW